MMDIPLLNTFFSWIEKKSGSKYYIYVVVLIAWVLACPHSRPGNFQNDIWNSVMLKSRDLTNTLSQFPSYSNAAKKVFRLTVPLVIKLFHLKPVGVLIIQYILGFLLIIFSYKLSLRILKDAVSATFISMGILFTFFGSISFCDMSTAWFDGWSYFFLVMALFQRNIFSIFFFATLAAWNDERAFIALPIVLLFHQINKDGITKYNFKELLLLNSKSMAVLTAIVGYIALRFYLQFQFGMHTPAGDGAAVGLSILKQDLYLLPIGMWTFLEGFWILFLLFILFAVTNKNYLLVTFILALTLILTIVAGCVLDITRSGAYLMPVIFVLISYLRNYITVNSMQYILFFVMTVCLIFPSYFIMKWGTDIYFMGYPTPVKFALDLALKFI